MLILKYQCRVFCVMDTTEYPILSLPFGRGRLYYFQGNFFHPLNLTANEPGLIARGIREFSKLNKSMIAAHRADPDYKTLEDLGGL